jgi:sialic acid synthase SpsE
MLDRLQLSPEALARCVHRAHEKGIHAIVTPFTVGDLGDVKDLGWDAYKTASPDLINRPLLESIADEGAPMVVSTGAATIDEVARAARWLDATRERLCFLQCVSAYPTPSEQAALGGIADIARATGLPTGYSDHTAEVATGALAVVAGACVLEKHVTHDTDASGPDHRASLSFEAFASYAQLAREASKMTREGKRVLEVERDVRAVSRQSLVTTRAVDESERVTRDMLTIKRPGTGIEPWALEDVIGRRTAKRVEADMPLSLEDLA